MKDYTRELKIAEIIARQEIDDISHEEREFLHNWLEESEENMRLYEKLLQNPGVTRAANDFDLDGFVDKTMQKIYRRRIRILIKRVSSVAAVILIGLFAVLLVRNNAVENNVESETNFEKAQAVLYLPSGQQVELNNEEGQELAWLKYAQECDSNNDSIVGLPVDMKIEVARGGEYKVRLDDGTAVWLNSSSSLIYPRQFTGDKRFVRLSGEAYFEVERDEKKPFVVSVDGMEIKVLGTSFNVAAYKGEETITTTLVSGSVEVSTSQKSVKLVPGNQAVVQEGDSEITITEVDPNLYVSWIKGVFKFDKMPLKDICVQLSRWYDVDFVFEGETGNEKFTGGTWKYVPLKDFLSIIEKVTDVSFQFEDSTIVVKSKN